MLVMQEMKNLSRLSDAEWTPAEPPKIHDGPVPERAVIGFGYLEGEWENCDAPLSGCLIRDILLRATVSEARMVRIDGRLGAEKRSFRAW